MPDIPVTFGSSLVGRLSCTAEFAIMLTDANTQSCRFELSGGYEKRHGENARLVELAVSPLPSQPAITDEEREAIQWAATFVDENYAVGTGNALRALLKRLT